MRFVISDRMHVRVDNGTYDGVISSHYRKITEEELLMFDKAMKFVNDNGANDLAKENIVETDEFYNEDSVDAKFSCLIIEEGNYYIELSEKIYPVEHIQVDWYEDIEEFAPY